MVHGMAGSWPELAKEMGLYLKEAKIDDALLELYRDIYQIWYRFLERVEPTPIPPKDKIEESFRQGRYLLADNPLPVDRALFKEALVQVIGAVVKRCPDKEGLKKLTRTEAGDELDLLFQQGASFDGEQMEQYLQKHGWDEKTGVEAHLLAFVIFTALAPFYIAAGAVVSPVELALWTEGFCPVCGQKPGMAKLRAEDGARVLECRLCRTQWQFSRLQCPFCANKDHAKLPHFYTDEHPGRRVQLCDRCQSYLKTAVEKEIGREVVLELENIFTIELDYLARREGYRPGEDLAVLT